MSIEDDELDEAVQAGVITQADVDKLQNFIAARRLSRLHEAGQEDERFRFMRGFNDFFFAIGILLLCAAMAFFTGLAAIPSLVAAAIVWGLSELLVKRMRLVLPGILLSLFFLFFVFAAVPVEYFLTMTPLGQRSSPVDTFTRMLLLDWRGRDGSAPVAFVVEGVRETVDVPAAAIGRRSAGEPGERVLGGSFVQDGTIIQLLDPKALLATELGAILYPDESA